jgi:hypothetical protein
MIAISKQNASLLAADNINITNCLVEDWTTCVRFLGGTWIFLFATAFRPNLGPIQPPIQGLPWALSPWVMRPERKDNTHFYLVPRFRMHGAVPPLSIPLMACYLIKHRGHFIVCFIIIIIIIIICKLLTHSLTHSMVQDIPRKLIVNQLDKQ